jgi:hypothetical protein
MKKLAGAALTATTLAAVAFIVVPPSVASVADSARPASASAAVAGHGAGKPSAGPATTAIKGYKTVGKFFVQVLTFKFNCTAAVIGRNVIVTAAHCFKGSLGGVSYNTTGWMFAPMWHDNKFPYGKWYVYSVYLARKWISKLDPRFDYAVVILKRRGGRSVGSYTGLLELQVLPETRPIDARPRRRHTEG